MDDIEEDLTISQYRKAVSRYRHIIRAMSSERIMKTINNDEDREKIAREIAKTSELIRKKYHALKTGKMEEDVILERQFKPITEPLKQLVENTIGIESDTPKIEPLSTLGEKHEEKKESKRAMKRTWSNIMNDSLITSTPKRKQMEQLPNVSSPIEVQSCQTMPSPYVEEIYESTPESLITTVRRELETSKGQKILRDHFDPLAQKYIGVIMSGDKNKSMGYVYGVKFISTKE